MALLEIDQELFGPKSIANNIYREEIWSINNASTWVRRDVAFRN